MILAVVCACTVVMEMFIGISAFFFSYRLFQLAESQNGKLSLKDVMKAWTRKFMRLAPVYYAIFFIGWGLFPKSTTGGPNWFFGAGLFETCKDDWWARLFMIGNFVPFFQESSTGCFFWGWLIDIDL